MNKHLENKFDCNFFSDIIEKNHNNYENYLQENEYSKNINNLRYNIDRMLLTLNESSDKIKKNKNYNLILKYINENKQNLDNLNYYFDNYYKLVKERNGKWLCIK